MVVSNLGMTVYSGTGNCEGLAIDWLARNIFWTDENKKTVEVARLDNTTIRRELVSSGLTHPRAIVLDPRAGFGFGNLIFYM